MKSSGIKFYMKPNFWNPYWFRVGLGTAQLFYMRCSICLWNCLPVPLRNPGITFGLFRRQLKRNLFRQAWTWRSENSDMQRYRKTRTYLLTTCHHSPRLLAH